MNTLGWERRLKHTTRIMSQDTKEIVHTSAPIVPPCCNKTSSTPVVPQQAKILHNKQLAKRQDEIHNKINELRNKATQGTLDIWNDI